MYFSTSGGREVTTKRQLDGLQPVKADKSYSYVPRLKGHHLYETAR